jgi:threonine aldolase
MKKTPSGRYCLFGLQFNKNPPAKCLTMRLDDARDRIGRIMNRRSFLASPVLAAPALTGLAPAVFAASEPGPVVATGDGIPHTPQEYSELLKKLSGGITPDSYSREGVVATLESKVAAALGKESAVWLPTGTLANHLAVRMLANEKRRVLVQHECHLFNDCGDCCQTLSGLHLVPLGQGKATFTTGEVESELRRADSGRVAVPIGALQIETPVRRKNGEAFDLAEMKKIVTWAREHKVGLHLDGARLYLAAAYGKTSVRDYAAMFDTVYISMYKYFNAASGAILAGPKSLLDDLYQTRRMFGGGLNHVWPFAAVALHFFDGFEERYRSAVAVSERVISALEPDNRFELRRVPNGTNIFYLKAKNVDPPSFRKRAQDAGLRLGEPRDGWFSLGVNETWNRASSGEIIDRLRKGMS